MIILDDEIIILVHNIIVLADKYEMFHVIPIPTVKTNTIFDVTHDVIAINEHSFLYPTKQEKINATHSICADVFIQRKLDCVALAFFHSQTNQSCHTERLGKTYTEFYELSKPNNILYYTSDQARST